MEHPEGGAVQNPIHHRVRCWGCLVLAAVVWPSGGGDCLALGLLDSFRSSVRGEGGDGASPRNSGRSDSYSGPHSDSAGEEAIVKLFAWTVLAPFYVPHVVLDDDFGVDAWYQRFPYDADQGHLLVGDPDAADGKWLAARLSAEYGNNLGHVSWVSGKALVSGPFRLGLETQFTNYQERLTGGGSDDLWVGDFNLVYRFAQCNWAEFRAGAGCNWFADKQGDRWGVNLTYAWDVTALRPFVWSAEIDLGSLGSSFLFHGRTTVGFVFWRTEAFVGGDLLSVGSTQISGLLAGVRVWF